MNATITPEMQAFAERYVGSITQIVDSLADYFEICASDPSEDLEEIRDEARDTLIGKGLPPIKATNMIRLAIYKANKRQGVETYSDDDLKKICAHVMGNR